ncbi:unnamed protein product [Schistosoma margrebowiei]|uniref:Uncharacterized protein n=1 Tax=Schistosoma margrebowiei TaxID=48269 RepID=A0A183LCM4_9TREM|nr:unnamed protein product [Schistosoma margrebowiei]
MKTSTSEGKHEIQWTSRMQLDDLDFADDLALLSQTQQQMQEKTTSVAAVGLNIHKGKSKIFRYNTACTNPITIDGENLEDVKTFTYLGSIIDEHGGSDARIGKARAAYLQLRNIRNSKQLSINTKTIEVVGPVKCYCTLAESSTSWVTEYRTVHRSSSRSRTANAYQLIVCHRLVHAVVVSLSSLYSVLYDSTLTR